MKKKLIVSIVASAAILMANPITNKADAASNTTYTKVYTYKSSNLSADQINALFEKYFKNIRVQQQPVETQKVEQQPVTTPIKQPVQKQQPAQKEDTSSEIAGYQLNQFEQQVVESTNQERAKNGLSALKVDPALSQVAREKSLDMQRNNYFSHTSPTYGSPFDMMKKFGITYRAAGENIAKGQRTPEEVVNAWMNSAGHRKNILSANFTHIGVGYVSSGNYWTQQFIGK
ncbi:putative YkwD family protein [Metabacillus crassostreae]|uniref:CAP domain-containing protein n=1 Tax=Metabacillus crassostreae TaxID=929098 RepID=UPI001959454C|nr:CAP domain-containing protein [Metabacillus crassostreae]MBM7605269.1 putative YkwD family protein [Metabacillus crassostreae]